MHMVRKPIAIKKTLNYSLEQLSKLINISGRQRMLSQRLSFLIFARKNNLNGPIDETFSLFESSHLFLKNGNDEFPAVEKGTEIYEYFFGPRQADKLITDYISFARDIYSGKSSDVEEFFHIASSSIVPLLNEAVLIYEKMSKELSDKIAADMHENSQKLINSMEDIKDVHKRIKIISVNASILASQAGSAGAAFNVVVGEIRGLANQIYSLIEEGLKNLKAQNKD